MRWKPPLLTLNRRVPRLPYKTKCKKKKSPDELRGNMGLTVFFEVLLNPRPASWRSCSTPHPPTAPRGWRRAPGRAGPGLQPAAGTPRPPPRPAPLCGSRREHGSGRRSCRREPAAGLAFGSSVRRREGVQKSSRRAGRLTANGDPSASLVFGVLSATVKASRRHGRSSCNCCLRGGNLLQMMPCAHAECISFGSGVQ